MELVPESLVKSVWEDQHAGRFEWAIRQASGADLDDPHQCWKVFQKILRAIEAAYYVERWGLELLPRPKINFLHRELLEIANAAGLSDLNERGLAEFLDDLCPCGLKSHREAFRKAMSRSRKTHGRCQGHRASTEGPRPETSKAQQSRRHSGSKSQL